MAGKNDSVPPLVIEDHPPEYDGVPWTTLIQYSGKLRVVAVCILEKDYLWAYSIESMTENQCEVFYHAMENYWQEKLYGEPLHFRVSPDRWLIERDLGPIFGPLLTAYNVENISRLIGPVRYPQENPPKTQIRRRKRIDLSRVEIKK